MTKATNKWHNWIGTVSCTPRTIPEPASVDEIAELLGEAEQNDRTIRVVATGHATNEMPCCDDIMLSTRKLIGLIDLDEDNKEATFAPHTHLESAAHTLAKRGYAFTMLALVRPIVARWSLPPTAAVSTEVV